MNKDQLAKEVIQTLRDNKFKVEEVVKFDGRTDFIFKINLNNKIKFFTIRESGNKKKDAKNKFCIWCNAEKISKEIIIPMNVNLENIFFIVIDFKPLAGEKPRFILAQLDETNYLSHGGDYSFDFNRPDYNGFFNTLSVEELTKKVIEKN